MIIPVRTLPPDFMRDPEKYRAHMFSAELDSWEADHRRPRGRLLDLLGVSLALLVAGVFL